MESQDDRRKKDFARQLRARADEFDQVGAAEAEKARRPFAKRADELRKAANDVDPTLDFGPPDDASNTFFNPLLP